MSGFEGSFLGASDKISAQAIMECKICWTPYDPADGDDFRQVLPGTAFSDLPDDWGCPNCDAPKEQFMVLEDPGSDAIRTAAVIADKVHALVADFKEIYNSKMRDVPIINKGLHVEAVGFKPYNGQYLGVLISPWFMNLVLLPADDLDWSELKSGAKEDIGFPSGVYEFIHNVREMVGGYKACSLFSPMGDFSSQMQAKEVARELLVALFDAENIEETDRAADIRSTRETELASIRAAELAAQAKDDDAPKLDTAPTRRAVLTAGLAATPETTPETTAEQAES